MTYYSMSRTGRKTPDDDDDELYSYLLTHSPVYIQTRICANGS